MPTPVAEVIAEIDLLLEPSRFSDHCPNGLQVPGPREISTLVTGVSASLELFEGAASEQAGLILVHHGLFWGSSPGPIDAPMKRRLQALFESDMALAAYHLPLDAHPSLGNNAAIADGLGCASTVPFASHHGEPIGCIATLPGSGLPIDGQDGFLDQVAALVGQRPLSFQHGPSTVRTVAIVSGAGTDFISEAAGMGADAFITGEPAERAMSLSKELSIHFLAAGHYATETFGVRRLGEHLAERFGLAHTFIDVPNPV